jgi:O-antigen/teichoic acid export membrane protein
MLLFSRISAWRKNHVIFAMGMYTISNFSTKAFSFLLIPVFTNTQYISTGENGMLNLFSQAMIFLIPFISLGVLQSSNTDFFKLDKSAYRDFFTTGFVMSVCVSALSFALFYLFRNSLYARYNFPPHFIWLIPAITFFMFCNELLLGMIRNNDKPVQYLVINVIKIVVELGVSIVLVVWMSQRMQGRITGIFVSFLLVFVYAMWYFISKGYLFGKIRMKYIRQEVIFALPIILMQWGVFCTNSSDRFILATSTPGNTDTTGVYGIACTFASVVLILCMALMQYMMPKIYALLAESTVPYHRIKKMFGYYFAAMTGGLLVLLIAIPIFYQLFIDKAYHPALAYYFYILLGYYCWAMAYFFYSFLLYHKAKKKILLLSLFNIATSLSIYYFFTKWWGVYGTAVGVCISFFIILMVTLLGNLQHTRFLFNNNINNN